MLFLPLFAGIRGPKPERTLFRAIGPKMGERRHEDPEFRQKASKIPFLNYETWEIFSEIFAFFDNFQFDFINVFSEIFAFFDNF